MLLNNAIQQRAIDILMLGRGGGYTGARVVYRIQRLSVSGTISAGLIKFAFSPDLNTDNYFLVHFL